MTALARPRLLAPLRLSPTLRVWLLTPPLLFGLRCCSCDDQGTAIDADGDGYYSEASTAACLYNYDCDDSDPDVHPWAEDPVGDDIDQNCDGVDGDRADDGGPMVDAE